MKVGFIGLGLLGKAIATRLISQGVDLVVWNRTLAKAADLGVEVAETPATVMNKAEVVFLNVFDSQAVEAVLWGKNGLLSGKCEGKLVIDTTTNHFESVRKFDDLLRQKGASYLEAPVLGSVTPALQGTLTILVSGDSKAFDRAKPLLEKISKRIFYLGERGEATKMKLINNMFLGAYMGAIAEATILAERSGINKETALEIVSLGAGNSTVLNGKKDKILREDFAATFTLAALTKDLGYLQDLAKSVKFKLTMVDAAQKLFDMALSEKLQDSDYSVVYKVIKTRRN